MKTSDTVGDICFHCDINERMSCSAGREARQRLFSSLRVFTRGISKLFERSATALILESEGHCNRATVRRNRNYATLTRECLAEI